MIDAGPVATASWADRFATRRSRLLGGVVGLGLLAAAVLVASRHLRVEAIAVDGRTLRHLLVIAFATILGIALSAETLLRLTRRFGRVGRGEMLALVTASTLLNYLPLRPGLLGRIAWHRLVNGIPTPAVLRTVAEALGITATIAALLLLGALAITALDMPWPAAAALPALATIGCLAHPALRVYAIPTALRHIETLLWAVRLHAAFAIFGVALSPSAALGLTVAAVAASTVPLVGNGLGIREWTIGVLAPLLAAADLAVGVSADLLCRAVEVAVILPAGLFAIGWLSRRRRLTPSPRSPDRAP